MHRRNPQNHVVVNGAALLSLGNPRIPELEISTRRPLANAMEILGQVIGRPPINLAIRQSLKQRAPPPTPKRDSDAAARRTLCSTLPLNRLRRAAA